MSPTDRFIAALLVLGLTLGLAVAGLRSLSRLTAPVTASVSAVDSLAGR